MQRQLAPYTLLSATTCVSVSPTSNSAAAPIPCVPCDLCFLISYFGLGSPLIPALSDLTCGVRAGSVVDVLRRCHDGAERTNSSRHTSAVRLHHEETRAVPCVSGEAAYRSLHRTLQPLLPLGLVCWIQSPICSHPFTYTHTNPFTALTNLVGASAVREHL